MLSFIWQITRLSWGSSFDEISCLPEGLAHLAEKALAANSTSA
jgi:hypothetical protein